jgi:hypothetical protein
MRRDALPTLQPHWVDIEINQSRVRIIKVEFTAGNALKTREDTVQPSFLAKSRCNGWA